MKHPHIEWKKRAKMLLWRFVDFLLALFLGEVFFAPNLIFGRGLRGGLLEVFLDTAFFVGDLRAFLRGDVLVVFFAGMINLRAVFWGRMVQY